MTAKATWDAEIGKLCAEGFNDLIKTEPRMQEAVLRILAGEVRAARQEYSDLASGAKVKMISIREPVLLAGQLKGMSLDTPCTVKAVKVSFPNLDTWECV